MLPESGKKRSQQPFRAYLDLEARKSQGMLGSVQGCRGSVHARRFTFQYHTAQRSMPAVAFPNRALIPTCKAVS